MNKQTKAIGRLVDIKQRSVEAAEGAYALALRATASAEKARDLAEAAWLKLCEGQKSAATDPVGIVGDLMDRDAQLRSLRRAADAAQRNIALVKRKETEASIALTSAKLEHKRYETFLERKAVAHAAEVKRVERVAEDEVSARLGKKVAS